MPKRIEIYTGQEFGRLMYLGEAGNPVQRQMIKEAMQAIAERKPGRSKLVYDKTKRTIVAVRGSRRINKFKDQARMGT